MLLKMMCKDKTGKQIVGIGQLTMTIGLGCNATAIILNRFVTDFDFLQGFLVGFGIVMLLTSAFLNIKGIKMVKAGE